MLKIVNPVFKNEQNTEIIYIDMSFDNMQLGGSALFQVFNSVGDEAPTVKMQLILKGFNVIQTLIKEEKIMAGHDVSAGGLITTLMEMSFADKRISLNIDLANFTEKDIIKILFAENPAIVIQVDTADSISHYLQKEGIRFHTIGQVVETKNKEQKLRLKHHNSNHTFDLSYFRNIWFKTSYLFDTKQSGEQKAKERYENYHQQSLFFDFLPSFTGKMQLTERK